MTLLADEIYLLREKERDQVEVYDVTTYRLQRCLTVPYTHSFPDMTSCEHNRCVYIGDDVVHLDLITFFLSEQVNFTRE